MAVPKNELFLADMISLAYILNRLRGCVGWVPVASTNVVVVMQFVLPLRTTL